MQALIELIATLRGENGCPWDRKQTPQSMSVYLIEEIYELVEAIEAGTPEDVCEELGDVLFHIFFLARLFEERGAFDIQEVIRRNAAKMIRRHPHVFGEARVSGTEEVRKRWHQIKKEEKAADSGSSVLDSIPRSLPALMRAFRISERAARAGFEWDDLAGVIAKAQEEWRELKTELRQDRRAPADRERAAIEFGDVLFTLVNVARFAKIHPETALGLSVRKFEARFKHMEAAVAARDRDLSDVSRLEFDRLWQEAKEQVG